MFELNQHHESNIALHNVEAHHRHYLRYFEQVRYKCHSTLTRSNSFDQDSLRLDTA